MQRKIPETTGKNNEVLPKKRGRPRKSTTKLAGKKSDWPEIKATVPKKRGRPSKIQLPPNEEKEVHDNPYSSGEEREVEIEPTDVVHIVKTKELFQYRPDSLIYFIDEFGYPLEEGAERLRSIQGYAKRDKYKEGLNIIKRKNKYLFEVVLDVNKSINMLKLDISKFVDKIFIIMKDKNLKSVSMSTSYYIARIIWDDIYNIIKRKDINGFKVMICENKLIYVK